MATALAAQLAQLASTKPQQDKYIKGKASLVFDYQKAADVSTENLLNIARSGIEALVKADKRFSPFTESLFSRSSVNGSREQLTAEENTALNATLAAFLRVLTNHYLSPAAFQVLEYCIRRYKVHVFNVDELLLCALPYHATPEFARLLVLLQLKGTPWEWLAPGQQSGAPPPRDIIVRRCVNDQAVLRVVCQGAKAVGVPGFVSKTFLSFYAVLLCEVLAASPRVTEDLLTLLLPFLAAGLKGDASREYTSATLMVLTQLLTRAQLSQEFLQVMLLDVVRSWSDLGGPTVLMMLAHLATTQPHCTTMPLKSLQVLAQEHVAVAQELASLQARQANLAPLLQLLLPAIAQALPNNPGLEPLACALPRQVTISPPSLVQAAAVQLLKAGGAAAAAGAESGSEQQPQHLQQVLKVFDLHYPEQLDAAINTAFQDAASLAAAAAGGVDDDSVVEGSKAKKHKSSSKHKQHAAAASSNSADALFAFVQTCFAGSRHEVLSPAEASSTGGQKQQQQQALTLSLAVHAPASEMRVMALQKLDALCAAAAATAAAADGGDGSNDAAGADAPGSSSSTRQLLQSALLSGLRDDVLAVAAAAAAAQGLAEVPGEQQLPALQYLLQRAAAVIAAGHVAAAGDANADSSGAAGGAKEALKAARAALAAVAAVGQRAAASDAAAGGAAALQQQATALLLEYVLADKRCKKLAKAAVKVVLVSCAWSPVLQALAAAPAVAAALEGAAADTPAAAAEGGAADTAVAPDSKRRKKGRQTPTAAAAGGGGDADADAAAAAAGGKHSGALALNRAVVAALAEAAATAGGDSSLVQQLGVLLSIAGPRCRQLLLLVLTNAAAAGGATAAGNTKPGSKPGGKAARGNKGATAAAAGDAGASSSSAAAVVANVLMQALEQQLEAAAAPTIKDGSSKGKGTPSPATEAVLPGSWADDASELLDSDSHLPTKQHMQQLPTQLRHMNAVLLLSGLHAALSAASAAALAQALGQQPVQLFARLAAAASGGAPGLLQHLQLIVEKSGESPEQQLHFLSGVYGLPSSIAGEAAQAIALQLLPQAVVASSSSSTWFVRLLAAADSSSKVVRQAAVSALSALSGSPQDLGVLGKGDAVMQAAHVQELLSSLLHHEQLLRNSAGALQRLLCSAAAGGAAAMDVDDAAAAPASVDGTSRVRRGSKTGSGSKAKAQQSPQQQGQDSRAAAAAAAAVLQLSADASAALRQLFTGALPCLHNEADLLGAQLAVAVLVAGFEPGTSSEPAQQLLQQLVSKLCKHKPTATSASFGKGAVWQQLAVVGHGAEAVAAAAAQLQQLRSDIAALLLQFYVAEVLQSNTAVVDSFLHLLQAPFSSAAAAAAVLGQHGSSVGADSGGAVLTPSQLAAVAAVRVAALQQFTPAAFDALQPQHQQAAFTAALQTLASDGVPACRDAARGCLQQLPVTSAMLLVLLQPTGGTPAAAVDAPHPTASKSKRARRASAASSSQVDQQSTSGLLLSQDAAAGQQLHGMTAAALDTAIAALEFMQWRDDVPDRQQLLQPLQQLLRLLVPLMGSIAETHHEEEQEDQEADAGLGVAAAGAVAAAAGGGGGVSASAAGYAAQLVLLVLEQMVKEQLASGGSSAAAAAAAAGSCVDVDLVLSCASAAPDGAVRNAALLLMAVLAQLSPEDVLEHVLKALAVIQHSAALQADTHSQAVATSTLSALVPAWLAAGRGSEELWGSLLGALPGLPAHRRLGLLESLLAALPQDKGLPVGLLLMMQHLVQLSTAKRAAAAAAAASTPPATAAASPGSRKGKKGKKQAAAEPAQPAAPESPAAATAADGGDDSQAEWLPELMASLCEKVDVQQRLQAFAGVLAASLTDSQGSVAAHEPLPRLAVSFVAANLKAKSVASAISAASSAAHSGAPEAQVALQESCQAIMTQALQHLLQLNPSSSTQDGSSSKQLRRLHKAINAASERVYSLLAALEAVQDCPSYLLALVQMSKQSSDSVQRRALKLLGDRLAKAQIDMADLEASTATLPAAARQAAMQELGEAGLAVCAELPRLLSPASPAVTKQLALVAADAGIRLFGKLLHPVVLASMLEVLKVVGDESAPVRASALACIASGVSALGVHLVPLLPSTAMAVLAAAEAAAQELAAAQAGSSGGGSDGEQQDEDDSAATAALQLAGAVAALDALVNNLGAFMSPYLPRVLQLLLHRQVLACTVAGANAVAGRLRSKLPTKIPARLLLQPLLQQWDGALAACAGGGSSSSTSGSGEQQAVDVDAAPAVALLDLVGAFASSLQPSDAAVYHEQLAGLLLQGLGTRSRWLAAAAGQQQAPSATAAAATAGADAAAAATAITGFGSQDVYQIEVAAVRALAALVMKLSESRFKPMFLRMVDWTNTAAAAVKAGVADPQQHPVGIGRVAALFAAVCTLSERLRSVFAPYYKYFFTLLMQQLAGEGLTGGGGGSKRSKKKRKLSAAADAGAGGDSSSSGTAAVLSAWLARLRAVRAVHLLALHEGSHDSPAAQQEQQERFDRLMPLLVEVLQEGPSAAVAEQLSVQGADASLDLPNSPVAALGAVGAAVVEAGGSRAIQESCDIVGTAAVGALVQMAVAGGSDVVWKPLHHALLLATRGGSTRAKLLALGGVSRLADLLREDYLNLLPEALGFIAELVEDGEVAVEAAAQGLLAQLEALSGESLEQYLKAS